MSKPQDPFFLGWGKVPKALRLFLASCAALLVVGFGVLAYLTSSTQTDTGSGAFMGQTRATGVLQVNPYPVLHVIDSPHFARGETILLSGSGKSGAVDQATGMDGQIVHFVEKPKDPESTVGGIALYYFRSDCLPLVGQYLAEGNNPDQAGHLIAWLVQRVDVHGIPVEGEWIDIGTPQAYHSANCKPPDTRPNRL